MLLAWPGRPAKQKGLKAVPSFSSSKLLAMAALLAMSVPAAAQNAGSTLPGGASSLQETYQDWSLSCQGSQKVVCAVSQQQAQQNGQRVLAVELRGGTEGGISGNLVLPFGLLLDAGAVLQIDDGQPRAPLRFSTCVPAGCLVPLDFDAKTIAALRPGTALKIKVQNMDKQEVTLSVSLKGLAAALDRLKVLAGA